ncbi:MAG: TRAP transporter permease [Pseudomonadota bacterium]
MAEREGPRAEGRAAEPSDPLAVALPAEGGEAPDWGFLTGTATARILFVACLLYTFWHLYALNVAPIETWTFRILHVAGALALGFGLSGLAGKAADRPAGSTERALGLVALAFSAGAAVCLAAVWTTLRGGGQPDPAAWSLTLFGPLLSAGAVAGVALGWAYPARAGRVTFGDGALIVAALVGCLFIVVSLDGLNLRLRAGTPFADPSNAWAAFVVVLLIFELTRRVAGLALVVIAACFVAYSFLGPWLPGFLEHRGYDSKRFFSYVFTDNGVLGPTTAVSSTYIILFIVFAAFLQTSKVGDYLVSFSFAIAGRARGGPAKVSVFASGLMGMINGTSAGNVVSTGSVTIPLMKKVGYKPQSSGAIEAAASTGGQIMPPIMGAGAFIMAEITGIPYTDLVIAALIPAVLYFASIYFMVDFEAGRTGMRGMARDELPKARELAKRVFLLLPIAILIGALFAGYSVIRAGTLAIAAATVVSWLTPEAMGPRKIAEALAEGARMSIQIIAVCAAAGVIVGVISLTGVGARFSSLLFELAQQNQLLGLVFAMAISVILGMGMPTTAAYAVAASVVAPGLIQIGVEPLIAHFFVFYFAVVSAITPPVALAAYAGAAIAGSDPMRTSVASFRVGLAAFIVPFMFFYSPGLLMEGDWATIVRNAATALVGVYLLAAAAQGWFFGPAGWAMRAALLVGALCMIAGDWRTDLLGLAVAGALFARVRLAGPAKA